MALTVVTSRNNQPVRVGNASAPIINSGITVAKPGTATVVNGSGLQGMNPAPNPYQQYSIIQPAQPQAAVATPAADPAAAAKAAKAAQDAAAAADEQAYYQDQMNLIDQTLGRTGAQRNTAIGNVDKQYQSAFDSLTGSQARDKQTYETSRNNVVQDGIITKSNIDTGVRNQNANYKRVLGASGAGNSSASKVLAPFLAAQAGNEQRTSATRTIGRNLQSIDDSNNNTMAKYTDAFNDLITQRDTNKNSINSGFDANEASLLQAKGDAAVAKAQAGGQNYTTARSARTPYASRISQLLANVDSLAATPTIAAKAVTAATPTLDNYTFDKFATPTAGVAAGADPTLASNVGSYYSLIAPKEKKALL